MYLHLLYPGTGFFYWQEAKIYLLFKRNIWEYLEKA